MTIQSKTYDKSSGRTHSDVVAGYDVPFSALDLSFSFDTMEKQSTIENLEGEIWKPVVGYEGLYEVSNLGRIRSIFRWKHYKIIKQRIEKGYFRIGLWNKGKARWFHVHRLVAMSFIPNPNNLPQINHIDENPLNNNIKNLEWCTRKYNCNYGTRNKRIREKNYIPVLQYTIDGKFVAEYKSIQTAANLINKNSGHISGCCRGKRKSAYGFVWRYKSESKKTITV